MNIESLTAQFIKLIILPTARGLMHGGRDWSCYENLDISTLNKAT